MTSTVPLSTHPTPPSAPLLPTPDVTSVTSTRATGETLSTQRLVTAPPPTAPQLAGTVSTADLASVVTALNGILDGFGTMLLAQQQLRNDGIERGTDAAEAGEANADNALERQREAAEAMERAQRRAKRLLGRAPRWVKKLVAALITVAGAVAGAFTGGVAAGLAIAGAVLILAGDALSKLLIKAGVDPEKAMWVGFAVKIVGTALSLGAGAAGGAASAAETANQAVQTAMRVINTATRAIGTVNSLAQFGLDAAVAVFEFQASDASADVDEATLDFEIAVDDQEDGIEVLREAHADYQRVVSRMQAWLTTQQQTTDAMIANLSA